MLMNFSSPFLQKIKTRFEEAPSESGTIQDLVVNELKTKKHTATEGLLWLTRYDLASPILCWRKQL